MEPCPRGTLYVQSTVYTRFHVAREIQYQFHPALADSMQENNNTRKARV
jgi:hypothetical protein